MKRKLKRLQVPRRGIQYIIHPETRAELSPFVFFDAGTMQRDDDGLHIGMHPHSGIGIITYFEGAHLAHEDPENADKHIPDGGVQWIRAGGGVWHQEHYRKKANAPSNWPLTLHQLWMQLPPELEESTVEYQNIQPEQLPQVGSAKVVVGNYEGHQSPLQVPFEMTYLDIQLRAGETFEFDTPKGQTTGFIFPRSGSTKLWDTELPLGKLAILESSEGNISLTSEEGAELVLALAVPQSYPIVTQGGSIHTNEAAMQRSFERIRQIAPVTP